MDKHWPSGPVSFTDLSNPQTRYNLPTSRAPTTHPPCNYQLPSTGQVSAWGELTLTGEKKGRRKAEGGRDRVVYKRQVLEE